MSDSDENFSAAEADHEPGFVVVSAPEAPAAPVHPISLDQFVRALSERDRRVALVTAFHREEMRARRVKDVQGGYQKRFDAFVVRPV